MHQILENLTNPDRGEVVWISKHKLYKFTKNNDTPTTPVGEILSHIFKERFFQTPIIANEQIIRHKISTATRSARKRCMSAIIEHTGKPSLGYTAHQTSSDASLYRTVLEHTGLYKNTETLCHWRTPKEIQSYPIYFAWTKIEEFFTLPHPHRHAKSVEHFINTLIAPPIGLRKGVLPLLLAAGIIAFGKALALRKIINGSALYVDDIQPSLIEEICEKPNLFELEVLTLTDEQKNNLSIMIECLTQGDTDEQEPDLIRRLYDALLKWKKHLPSQALTTQNLGQNANILQPILGQTYFDPVHFLFKELPIALKETQVLSLKTVDVFKQAICEIENVLSTLSKSAVQIATTLFNNRLNNPSKNQQRSLLTAASEWVSHIPFENKALTKALGFENGIIKQARQLQHQLQAHTAEEEQKNERDFVNKLSLILIQKELEEWDDKTLTLFQDHLEQTLTHIEETSLKHIDLDTTFSPLLYNKLAAFFNTYSDQIGADRLMHYLNEIRTTANVTHPEQKKTTP